MLQEAGGTILPGAIAVGVVIHKGRAVEEHGVVVGPLSLVVYFDAVCLVVCAIVDLKGITDESDLLGPVVDLAAAQSAYFCSPV